MTDERVSSGAGATALDFSDPATRLRIYEAGLARTSDVVLIVDLAAVPGRIVFANRAFERVTGWNCAEALGRTPEFLCGPGTDPAVLAEMASELRADQTVRREICGRRRDGSDILVEVEVVPLASDPHPALCIAVARDITERHRDAQSRQRLADLLQTSQQLADVGGWELDLDSGHLFWTRQTYLLMGVDPASYVPTVDTALAFYLPESRERLAAAMATMIERGERLDVEAEIVTGRGEHRHVRINNDVVRAGGRVVKIYGAVQDITARVLASAELRASEHRWKFALEGSGDAVWDWDIVSGKVTRSPSWAPIFGYLPHEIPGDLGNWTERIHPEDRARVEAALQEHLAGAAPHYSVETRMRRKDGSWVWLMVRGTVTERSGDGQPLRMIGTLSDISARKAAKAELEYSRRRLEDLIATTDGIVWEADLDSCRTTYVSASAERTLGYPCADWINQPNFWRDHLHPDDRERTLAYSAARTALGESHRTEYRMLTADGRWIWIDDIATVVVSPGQPSMLRGVMIDITARKLAEQALRASESRLQMIFGSMAEGLVVQDSAGVIIDCNHAAERILGLPASQLLGRTSIDPRGDAIREDGSRFHESQQPAMLTLVTESPQRDVVMGIRGGDGQRVWLSINTSVASDPRASSPLVVSSFGDISARKALEHQLEERNALLQRRTAEAQALARTKATFLANMSHEMRTPLAAIIGLSEQALLPDADADSRHAALLAVHRSAAHMLEIVNDVLDATRLDSGRLPLCPSPVDVLQLCTEVCELLRHGAQAKSIELRQEVRWPLPATISVDRLRLKQVLLNLVSNAIKFTDRGSVCVTLAASREEGLRIDVSDTGIGIDASLIEDLFRPFVQGESSNSRRFGGTGLGLYISRELVQRMGGALEASSAPDQGSRFRLTLPLDPVVRWTQTASAAGAIEEPERPLPPLRGTVLLAEDDPTLRELFVRMLRRIGLGVLTAEDGAEAVHLALNRDVDLILMDMHMPMIDGRAATRRLRNLGHASPIIAVTADMVPESVAGHLQSGCNAVLGKPASLQELHRILSAWLATDLQAEIISEAESRLAAVRARFLSRLREDWMALQQDLHARRYAPLRDRLHRIKGAAGMFGLKTLHARCAAAEAAAAEPGVDGAHLLEAMRGLAPAVEEVFQGKP